MRLPKLVATAATTLLLLATVPPPAGAQNRVEGGTFDVPADLDAWTIFASSGSTATWDALDAGDADTSGSLRLEIDPDMLGNALTARQCFEVVAGTPYDFGASLYQPSGQPASQSFVRIQWHGGSDCDGGVVGTDDSGISLLEDTWDDLLETGVPAPGGAGSAELVLVTFEDPSQMVNRVVYWDDVVFVPEALAATGAMGVMAALGLLRSRRRRWSW